MQCRALPQHVAWIDAPDGTQFRELQEVCAAADV